MAQATFSWASLADVGLGALQGFIKGQANSKSAALKNEVRASENAVRRSSAGLAATVQGINNNRLLQRAAANQETMERNALHAKDAATNRGFEGSVRSQEQLGATAAKAAASGLGGASIAAISQVVELSIDRQEQYRKDNVAAMGYEQYRAMASVMGDALASWDSTPIVPKQDQTIDYAGSLASYLIGGAVGKKESLNTLLGSLAPAGPEAPAAPPSATTSPVDQGRVRGTPLSNFNFDLGPYEDTQRFINRSNTVNLK